MQLAKKLTRLPLGYVLERDSGIIKKNMENDVEELERFLAHNIPETISSFTVPVAVILYLACIDWRMALSMVVCIPFALFFYTSMMRGSKEKMQKYYRSVDKMNAVVVEYVNGMKEIKAFNQSEHSFFRFKNAIEEYRRYVLDWYKSCWPLMSAYFVLIQASIVIVLPVGLYFMMNNSLDLSIFILFLLISLGFAAPLIKLTEFADGIILVVNAEQNIHSMMTEKELSSTDAHQTPKNTKIAFCDVSFSYDGKKEVLKKISFLSGALLATLALRFVFKLLEYIFQSGIGYEIVCDNRLKLGEKLLHLSMGFYNNTDAGNISSVINNDLVFVESMAMNFLSKIIGGIISGIFICNGLAHRFGCLH